MLAFAIVVMNLDASYPSTMKIFKVEKKLVYLTMRVVW